MTSKKLEISKIYFNRLPIDLIIRVRLHLAPIRAAAGLSLGKSPSALKQMPATHISTVKNYRREASMKDLNALGKPSKLPNSPDEAELERVANRIRIVILLPASLNQNLPRFVR